MTSYSITLIHQPHWSAIASAIPWYVLLLSFHRCSDGGIMWILGSLPSTIFVGVSFGNPFSQRQVAFVSPCPNCQGWIIWSGLRYLVDISPTGFSIAILSTCALTN